jgi:thymidine kinase
MAKLYFYYSAMNAGKSTALLQAAWNYQERGLRTLLLTPRLDTRDGIGKIASRIGLTSEAIAFSQTDSLLQICREEHDSQKISCVMVDEAQFLTRRQVFDLGEVADGPKIPVVTYGLRTDFRGDLFEGSQHLLAWADVLSEIKTICHCGKKATMVLRLDGSGRPIRSGEQIQIGGNDTYVSVCRRHFKAGMGERDHPQLPFGDLPPVV